MDTYAYGHYLALSKVLENFVSNFCLLRTTVSKENFLELFSVSGAYSEWLSEHPDVIGLVLPLLLKAVGDPSLAQSASMSLKDLVRECQLHLQPYASTILTAAKVKTVVFFAVTLFH